MKDLGAEQSFYGRSNHSDPTESGKILPRGNRMPQEQAGAVQEELFAATEILSGSRSVVENGRMSQMHG